MDDVFPQTSKNRLLAALPDDEIRALKEGFELVSLSLGHVLYESGDRITHAFFPTTAIVSLLLIMENGDTAEVGIAGNNGVVGLAAILGAESTISRAVVQSAGEAVRMPRAAVRKAFETSGLFRELILRYTASLLSQISQTAACNRLHTIEQQLCRWLLINDDLVETNELVMTQELIANMLGVRREGVSAAAGNLQRLGIITYTRGSITILDRERLESEACECYRAATEEYDRLMGPYLGSQGLRV